MGQRMGGSQAIGYGPAGGGLEDAFYFRLDPTITTQFYTAGIRPAAGGGTNPVITADVDAQGRPVTKVLLRTAGRTIIPLLTPDLSGPLGLDGRFIVQMRANFNVSNAESARRVGVCFNLDPADTASFLSFGAGYSGTGVDSIVDGVTENLSAFSQLTQDADYEQPLLWVDVQLSLSKGTCTYWYSGTVDQSAGGYFRQQRKVALKNGAKTGVGLVFNGNVGTTEISELIIWKSPSLW